MTTEPKTAACPHCGCEEFDVCESENKRIRLTGHVQRPFMREQEISSEGKGYETMICSECGVDLNAHKLLNDLMESIAAP